jgi:hypothetical protein
VQEQAPARWRSIKSPSLNQPAAPPAWNQVKAVRKLTLQYGKLKVGVSVSAAAIASLLLLLL